MISAEQQRDWFKNLIAQAEPDLLKNNMAWFHQARCNAKRAINSLPTLHRKQEAWRYNRIDKLFEQNFKPLLDGFSCHKLDIRNWLLPGFDSYRLVFVNGRCLGKLSDIIKAPDDITIGSLHAAINLVPKQVINWFSYTGTNNNQLFSALNMALLNDGAVIHIDDHIELDKPIEVIYLNTNCSSKSDDNDGVMIQSRNIITLGVGAKATLVERFIGIDQGKYFHNSLSDILLAEGASLKHYRVQDESREAHHLSNLQISQQKNSRYYSSYMAFGSAWSKTHINVDFKEEGGECVLNGLYVVGDQQLTDFHLDVRHSVPD